MTSAPQETDGRFSRVRALAAHVLFSSGIAAEAVGHNKLRAGLTSMGILFGVASVIAMLAIGNGAEQEILAQMKLLGANNIVITPIVEQKGRRGIRKVIDGKKQSKKFSPGLTYLDAQAIRNTIPAIAATSAEVVVNSVITREGHHRSGKLVGVDSSYFEVMNLHVGEGAPFAALQFSEAAPVAIIGQGVKSRFFTTEDPIGRTIKVGTQWLTWWSACWKANGGAPRRRRTPQALRDASMDVYVPLAAMLLVASGTTAPRRIQTEMEVAARDDNSSDSTQTDDQRAEKRNYHQLDKVVVQVKNAEDVSAVAEVSRRMLQRRHNDVTDFEIVVPELLLKQQQRTKTIFNVVLGAIASISLVVGGIGIMNIMLASILERIKEIGVRRAMGATQRDVLAQFLSEAVMISLAGGIAGIILGGVLASAIERLAHINTIVSGLSVFVAFGVSVAVGLVFGIVPAQKAAKQDPIVCLRYE